MTSKKDLALIDGLGKGMDRLTADVKRKERELGAERMAHTSLKEEFRGLERKFRNADEQLTLKTSLLETRDLQFEAQRNEIKGMINMTRIYASGGKPI